MRPVVSRRRHLTYSNVLSMRLVRVLLQDQAQLAAVAAGRPRVEGG